MADKNASYVFSQNPSAVPNSRKKFRDAPIDFSKHNIMWDKRVLRGNTYSAQIPTPNQIVLAQKQAQSRPRQRRKKEVTQKNNDDIDSLVMPGRHNMEVQTDDYLEDLDEAVMEQDAGCQTDFIIDVEDPVIKYRKPYGNDQYTFIEEGELFTYDDAVDPILETLMGKALDNGHAEVLQEQELKWWEEYHQVFEANRQAVIAANKEMERKAMEQHEKKESLMQAERERYNNEKDVAHKVGCNSFARNWLANFQSHVMGALEEDGFFFDPATRDVTNVFLPWIREQVFWQLNEREEAGKELDRIMRATINQIKASKVEAMRMKEEKRLREEEEQRRLEEERRIAEEEARAAAELNADEDEGDEGDESDEDY